MPFGDLLNKTKQMMSRSKDQSESSPGPEDGSLLANPLGGYNPGGGAGIPAANPVPVQGVAPGVSPVEAVEIKPAESPVAGLGPDEPSNDPVESPAAGLDLDEPSDDKEEEEDVGLGELDDDLKSLFTEVTEVNEELQLLVSDLPDLFAQDLAADCNQVLSGLRARRRSIPR